MGTDRYTVHRRALLWFLELDPAEREALDATIARLVELPVDELTTAGAIGLDSPEPIFMLKLGPSLRAFVQPTPGGKPEVQDFVHQETLDWFKSLVSTQKPSAPVGTGKASYDQ